MDHKEAVRQAFEALDQQKFDDLDKFIDKAKFVWWSPSSKRNPFRSNFFSQGLPSNLMTKPSKGGKQPRDS
jgi:hypothetical protein